MESAVASHPTAVLAAADCVAPGEAPAAASASEEVVPGDGDKGPESEAESAGNKRKYKKSVEEQVAAGGGSSSKAATKPKSSRRARK